MSRRRVATWIAYAAVVYLIAATSAYRFRHPDLSETRLFLDIPKALAWR